MTSEIKNKITQLHSIIDEAFDVKKTTSYQLLLQVGTNDIQVAIHDKQKNKFIALEKYEILNAYNFAAVSDLLDTLIKESKIINHKFHSVVCTISNNLSTLVPNALFEEDRKKLYLKFNASLEGDELVMLDDIKSLDAKNVFAVPFAIKAKLDAQYPNIKYNHASSILIDTLITNNKNQTGKKIFVHLQSTHFEILVIDGKNLIFYNTFNFHSPEDFIYYLLFTFEQLQLNPEKIELIFIGEVEKSSTEYILTQKYVRNITFAERPTNVDFSYQLQNLPKHSYFTLFNSLLT